MLQIDKSMAVVLPVKMLKCVLVPVFSKVSSETLMKFSISFPLLWALKSPLKIKGGEREGKLSSLLVLG